MHAQSFLLPATIFFLNLATASPLVPRSVCGSAPTGPTGATPLSQPSDITTPAKCQAACEAMSACESFVCGFVNNAPVCMLYAVPAASVPPQSSTNLVAYDVACGSVPTTTLSATNPSGAGPASGSGTSTGTGSGAGNGAGTGAGSGTGNGDGSQTGAGSNPTAPKA